MMKRIAGLAALAAVYAPFVHAQAEKFFMPSFGVQAGVPVTSMFTTYSISALDYPVRYSPYSSAVPSYEVGPYALFHFTKHFGFEVGALYRPGELAFEQPLNQLYQHTHFKFLAISVPVSIHGQSRTRSSVRESRRIVAAPFKG